MSMWDDLVTGGVDLGVDALFNLSGVDAKTASNALKIGGATLQDIGVKLEDGHMTSEELEDIMKPLQNFEGGAFGLAVKSFVNRVAEYFMR